MTGTIEEPMTPWPRRVIGRAAALRDGLPILGAPGHNGDRGIAYLYLYDPAPGRQFFSWSSRTR